MYASRNDNKVSWSVNNGGSPPTFTQYVIASDVPGAAGVAAGDVNGDGLCDVAVGEC